MTLAELYQIYLQHPQISTDTRNILPGSLFFALTGDRFNANTFAVEAIRSGAAYAVIDEAEYKASDAFLLVENVLETLQELAKYHRSQLTIPIIGITGSNGKTTTKELLAAVLSRKFHTLATKGNLNNHIGVPLTLLSIGNEVEIAVIEMGANHQKEIGFLCSIAQPTHGLITNVGKAHLEGFGGFEGVKKGKGELYSWLAKTDGTIFINGENLHLEEMLKKVKANHVIRYNGHGARVNGRLLSSDPFIRVEWENENDRSTVQSNLTGTYNLDNILAAVTIGLYFDVRAVEVNEGIRLYLPSNNRSQVTETANNRLICDYYNANPASMAVALENLASLRAAQKVTILGDMFELGKASHEEHEFIVKKAMAVPASRRLFIGKDFFAFADAYPGAEFFITTAEALEALAAKPVKQATVLIKGSRGMRMEALLGTL